MSRHAAALARLSAAPSWEEAGWIAKPHHTPPGDRTSIRSWSQSLRDCRGDWARRATRLGPACADDDRAVRQPVRHRAGACFLRHRIHRDPRSRRCIGLGDAPRPDPSAGGGIAITTHTTKLGLRYAIDASPEPFTNGVANVTEFALVAAVAIAIWQHPIITLSIALVVLAFLIMMVRLIWRALRQVISGRWMPAPGLMQDPRVMERRGAQRDELEPL